MDNTRMEWIAKDETIPQNSETKSELTETEETLDLVDIILGHESNIDNDGSDISYDSVVTGLLFL